MARTSFPQKYSIGVDPGGDGGMSLLNSKGEIVYFDRIYDLPNIYDFFDKVRNFHLPPFAQITCVYEEYKGDGAAVATRSSGRYVGIFQTLCHHHKIKFVPVAPQTWKAHFKLIVHQAKGEPKMSDTARYEEAKRRSMNAVRTYFPDVNLVFPRCKKEHEGVAESLLIAEYGRQLSL